MKRIFGWASCLALSFAFAMPLWFMLFGAMQPDDRVFSAGVFGVLDPTGWSFENFGDAWHRGATGYAFLNSLIQVSTIVVFGFFVNSLAAYAFARLDFYGRDVVFACIVILLILPIEVLAVPLLFTVRDLGLTGGRTETLLALSLPFAAKAFNIYFLRQHFLVIPRELEEAALIDGASRLRIYWSVALPLVRPALATVAVLDVLAHWSDFLWPLMVSTRSDTQTIQLSLAALFTQPPIKWGDVLASSTIATLPMLLLFQLMQRHMVTTDLRAGIRG